MNPAQELSAPIQQQACPVYAPGSLLLQWHVTERCNLRCQHCYQAETPGPELSFADLTDILAQFWQLAASLRPGAPLPAQITLTGGEPFIRRDFPDLLELITSQREWVRCAILSNGTLINASRVAWLKKLGVMFVQVSLDGTQTTHDRIRGPGSFEQTLAAIHYLTAAKVPTLIAFTAQRQNYREFTEVARLGRRLKVQRVWADRVIPAGRNQQELVSASLTSAETREFIKIIAAARREATRAWFNHTEISTRRALQFLGSGAPPYRCTAGGSLISVMANGDLVPCRRMPIVVGNLRQKPLAELYQCDLFQSLRTPRQASAGCEGCFYVHLCAGGLRCLAYALTGSPFRADPGCWCTQTGTNETS